MKIRDLFNSEARTAKAELATKEKLVGEIMELSYRSGLEMDISAWRLPRNGREMHSRMRLMTTGTLSAILAASKHPAFKFKDFYSWLYSRDIHIKNAALFFDALNKSAVEPAKYPKVTGFVHALIDGNADDLAAISADYIDDAILLAAELYLAIPSIANNDDYLCSELRLFLRENPHRAHEILDFMLGRGITHLSHIDPFAFNEAASSASASLSGGIL